jgi:hypothetical protein
MESLPKERAPASERRQRYPEEKKLELPDDNFTSSQ